MGSLSQIRAIADTDWDSLVEGRVILLGDFNAHSSEWNLHCRKKRDAADLQALIEKHYLILNNELEKATRPTRRNTTSIMDLTFTTQEIGALDTWIIDRELSTPSNYEVIVCELTNLDETVGGMRTSQEVTGRSFKALPDEEGKEP